jgi:adenylate kinase
MGSLPNVHIIGIQGSGKGTQSAGLVDRYGFLYLPSGNLFRNRAKQDDFLGHQISSELEHGHLLPDALVYHTVIDYLGSNPFPNGILGDGVIRNQEQYRQLEPIWEMMDLGEPAMLHLLLDEKIAYGRLLNRVVADDPSSKTYAGKLAHRSDDNPAAIEERFALFRKMTEPLIRSFAKGDRYVAVDGNRPIDAVQSDLRQALERLYPDLRPASGTTS